MIITDTIYGVPKITKQHIDVMKPLEFRWYHAVGLFFQLILWLVLAVIMSFLIALSLFFFSL